MIFDKGKQKDRFFSTNSAGKLELNMQMNIGFLYHEQKLTENESKM
jgi:hypothetical protein